MHCRRYSSTPIHESHRRTPQSQATVVRNIDLEQSLQETRSQRDLLCLWVVAWRICWCRAGVWVWPHHVAVPSCHIAILPCCHLQLYSITFSSKVLQHCSCSDVLTLAVWAWLNEKVSHDKTIKRCDAAAEQQQYQSSWNGFTVDGHWIHIEVLVGWFLTLQDLFMFDTLMSGGLEAAVRRKSCEMKNVTLWHSVLLIFDIRTAIPFNDFW